MPSKQSSALIAMYSDMTQRGYETVDQQTVTSAFNDMEVRKFRDNVKAILRPFNIRSVLDCGCGGSDYEKAGFSGEQSAKAFFQLDAVYRYGPRGASMSVASAMRCSASTCWNTSSSSTSPQPFASCSP